MQRRPRDPRVAEHDPSPSLPDPSQQEHHQQHQQEHQQQQQEHHQQHHKQQQQQLPPPSTLTRTSSTSRATNQRPRFYAHSKTASTDSDATAAATTHHQLDQHHKHQNRKHHKRPTTDRHVASPALYPNHQHPSHHRWRHHLHLRRIASSPASAESAASAASAASATIEPHAHCTLSFPLPSDRHVLPVPTPTPTPAPAPAPEPEPEHERQDPGPTHQHTLELADPSSSIPRRRTSSPDARRQDQAEPEHLLPIPGLDLGASEIPLTVQHTHPAGIAYITSPLVAAVAASPSPAIPWTFSLPTIGQRISHRFRDRKQPSRHTPLPSHAEAATTQPQYQARQVPHHNHAAMPYEALTVHRKIGNPFSRTSDRISTHSANTSLSGPTMSVPEPASSNDGSVGRRRAESQRCFVTRNGRTYVADPTIPYPLPVDLPELHRQSLRVLMMLKLFGRPICSPVFRDRPPARVLDVGCGTALWSMKCHEYWAKRGHKDIDFTGIDIVPIAGASPSTSDTLGAAPRPDKNMTWRFAQHDVRMFPWPFADNEFDLTMMLDPSMFAGQSAHNEFMDEVLRITRPGGVIEVWESDHIVRMLRPHVPAAGTQGSAKRAAGAEDGVALSESGSGSESDEVVEDQDDTWSEEDPEKKALALGAYIMTANTPMSSPLNNFLVEYNSWVTKALESRSLSPVPCTLINPMFLQEENLTSVGSKRLAVPLSEVKWEREGVGGVVTKDGKSYVKGLRGGAAGNDDGGGGGGGGGGDFFGSASAGKGKGKGLTASQAAIRRTALMTIVQLIQSLEPLLREASGKSQDEWDGWMGKMMNDLLKENGTSWGECLELGAWWATKKS